MLFCPTYLAFISKLINNTISIKKYLLIVYSVFSNRLKQITCLEMTVSLKKLVIWLGKEHTENRIK